MSPLFCWPLAPTPGIGIQVTVTVTVVRSITIPTTLSPNSQLWKTVRCIAQVTGKVIAEGRPTAVARTWKAQSNRLAQVGLYVGHDLSASGGLRVAETQAARGELRLPGRSDRIVRRSVVRGSARGHMAAVSVRHRHRLGQAAQHMRKTGPAVPPDRSIAEHRREQGRPDWLWKTDGGERGIRPREVPCPRSGAAIVATA